MTEKLIEEIISYRHKDLIEENVRLKDEIMQIKQSRTYYKFNNFDGGYYFEVSKDELTAELKETKRVLKENWDKSRKTMDLLLKKDTMLSKIKTHWAYKLFIERGLE